MLLFRARRVCTLKFKWKESNYYIQMCSYKTDEGINLEGKGVKVTYIISSQHRMKGKAHKSYWTIPNEEEVECFLTSLLSGWEDEFQAWGLKIEDEANLEVLGRNVLNLDVKIAKFVDGNHNKIWHGYPADYVSNSQDRPTTKILSSWVDKRLITKAKMARIRQGKPCNL